MSRKSDDASSSSVREFIYLDIPKIYSYLSQIEGGLRLLIQRVEGEYSSTELQPEVKEDIVRFTAAATVGAKVPFLGNADADLGYEHERRTSPADERVTTGSSGGRSDLSVLHHKAFDLVMEKLSGKFSSHLGRTSIVSIVGINQLLSIMPGSFDSNAQTGMALMRGLGVENIVYCETSKKGVHGFLTHDHFTIQPNAFQLIYGLPSEEPFHIVGIQAKKTFATASVGTTPTQAKGRDVTAIFDSLHQFNHIIDKFFAVKGERIYPLAIYKELG